MKIGDVISEADAKGCSPLLFEHDGMRCAVADGWGEYFGMIIDGGKAEVVATGWSQNSVIGAVTGVAQMRQDREHEAPSMRM